MINFLLITMLYSPPSVSQENIFLIGYTEGNPAIIDSSRIPGKDINGNFLYLRTDAAEAWKDMLSQAAQDGIFLEVVYAFRNHETQKRLKRKRPRKAARPGFSPHEAGLAVDINNCTKRVRHRKIKTETYRWLKANAPRFGFIQPVPNEPWHWTYQG